MTVVWRVVVEGCEPADVNVVLLEEKLLSSRDPLETHQRVRRPVP